MAYGGQPLKWDYNGSKGFPGELGRKVTDEVIERDDDGTYKGRRVVLFTSPR